MDRSIAVLLCALGALFLPGLLLAQTSSPSPADPADVTIEDVSLEDLLNVTVSTAAKYEQSAREAAASVTVITSAEIEAYGYRTLSAVLDNVRGFYVSNDRENPHVGVRGFGRTGDYNSRVLILLDGHARNEVASGYAYIGHLFGVDMSQVERIEIVRGPGSVLYGTGALFAVVNVVTKRAAEHAPLEVTAEVGSFGTRTGAASVARTFGERTEAIVSGFWGRTDGSDLYFAEFDDAASSDGWARDLDWQRQHGVTAAARHGAFTLRGAYAREQHGIPTAPGGVEFNHRASRSDNRYGFVEATYEADLGPTRGLRLRAFSDHSDLQTTSPYDAPPSGKAIAGLQATSHAVGGETQFRWDTSPRNRLVVGTEYHAAQAHALADMLVGSERVTNFDQRWHYEVFSAYAQDEFRVSRNASVTVGLRHDRYSSGAHATTPRAALVVHPTSASTVKMLYGEAFRGAGLAELYQYDPWQHYIANPNLKPERIRTAEVVWEQQLTPHLSSTVTLFRYRMRDLIDRVFDPGEQVTQNRNVGRVVANGFEAEMNARLEGDRHGYASYAFADPRDAETDLVLTNAPRHLARAGLRAPLAGPVRATLQLRYESGRRTMADRWTDAALLADATLTTQPLMGHLRLRLGVKNVLDARYAHPASLRHRQDVLEQDGRRFVFGATIRL